MKLVGVEVDSQCKLKGHLHLKSWIIIFLLMKLITGNTGVVVSVDQY